MTLRNRVWGVVFILLAALSSPHGWPDAAAEGSGELRVESEPAGATVYVDGHLAGQTPLSVATLAPGVHRVRLVRPGYLENARLVTVTGGTRAAVRTQLTAAAPPLKIVVVEGEGAVNIIQQKTAVVPVVEVRVRNDQPVSGAVVRFAIQKGRATFNGARTLTATTDALGRATAAGLAPTGSGPLNIAASATFQGQTAAVSIVQTNVLTAAQAATAATAGTGGAGGGGLSHFAIAAIVGGAGAGIGGALIASKAANGCSGSPVCGAWNVAATGTISATPSGGDYLGTATLGGVTVSVRATRFSG